MKFIDIKFCDRRKIKKIRRKKYVTNNVKGAIYYRGGDVFTTICDSIGYEAEMILVDKNKFLSNYDEPYWRLFFKNIPSILLNPRCYVSKSNNFQRQDFVFYVFDNERSFALAKLLS